MSSEENVEAFVIAVGNSFDGTSLYGPFHDPEEATEWAEKNAESDWWLVGVTPQGSV